METAVTPEQVLADAEQQLRQVRAEMLEVALPLHKDMYPDHGDHADLSGRDRDNKIIGEVLQKISMHSGSYVCGGLPTPEWVGTT